MYTGNLCICGHTEADHSARVNNDTHEITHGFCMGEDCLCREFEETSPANQDGSPGADVSISH